MADPFSGATSTNAGSAGGTSTAGTAPGSSPGAGTDTNWLSDISSAIGLESAIQQGGVKGATSAATSAAKLGSNLGLFGSSSGAVGSFAADVANLGNIIQGLQQGGVMGYGTAAVNTAALAGRAGTQLASSGAISAGAGSTAATVGAVAAPLASALSVYQFAKQWQSGKTGQDALAGAQTGATIGTEVLPGVGTLVGAGLGAAVGALSSLFGPGARDPETSTWNDLAGKFNALTPTQQSQVLFSPQQAMTNLAGTMDARNNSPGHSQPIEQVFGRMGENNLVQQMTTQINSQIASGAISKTASVNDIYNQVVSPWLASKGASINMAERTSTGNAEGPALVQSLKSVIAAWQNGGLTSSTQVGINGQTISGLQAYGAQPVNTQAQTQQQTVHQQLATFLAGFPLSRAAGTKLV